MTDSDRDAMLERIDELQRQLKRQNVRIRGAIARTQLQIQQLEQLRDSTSEQVRRGRFDREQKRTA